MCISVCKRLFIHIDSVFSLWAPKAMAVTTTIAIVIENTHTYEDKCLKAIGTQVDVFPVFFLFGNAIFILFRTFFPISHMISDCQA